MNKLWVIAYKDIRSRFSDRTLLLIMLAAPLAIATIIGLAFGGLGRTTSPIQHIPVAVVNNDKVGSSGTSFGATLAGLLTEGKLPADASSSMAACPQSSATSPTASSEGSVSLGELINGTHFDQGVADELITAGKIDVPPDPPGSSGYLDSAAWYAVQKGIYTAAVIIPEDFSKALTSLSDPRQTVSGAGIIVYGNAGNGLSAGIVRSVVDSIVAKLVSGNIAIGATLRVVSAQQPALLANVSSQSINNQLICAFAPGGNLVTLSEQPVQASQTSMAGAVLVTFGSAQALFFALYTGQFGILSMYEERRAGTLQRILVTPTPRWTILGGKLVGVLVSVLFQLLALVFALTVVGSLIERRAVFIWGNDYLILALLLLAVAIATSGLGMFLAGVLKGIEQANIVGSVLNIALGVLGGAFGFQLPRSVAQFSLVYWARDGFDTMAAGRGDIFLNILVLLVEGVILFLIGLFLFNSKFEI